MFSVSVFEYVEIPVFHLGWDSAFSFNVSVEKSAPKNYKFVASERNVFGLRQKERGESEILFKKIKWKLYWIRET